MTDCTICLSHEVELDVTLACGHSFHQNCISKHFKQECALCRAPHSLVVTGSRPSAQLDVIPKERAGAGKKETLAEMYKRMLEERKAEYEKIKDDQGDQGEEGSSAEDVSEENLSDYADYERSDSEDYDY